MKTTFATSLGPGRGGRKIPWYGVHLSGEELQVELGRASWMQTAFQEKDWVSRFEKSVRRR